jgi:sigma-B regulation protein RsbU (phosphoserine phosphatase)
MSQAAFKGALVTRRTVDFKPLRSRSRVIVKPRREELEAKITELQQNYAELHTEVFEAAQVHRRMCAPRLIHHGNFHIASEIFAVRHLPGDFFTVKQSSSGVILALGDICGKGLAAGMWTTHLVGLVGARGAVFTEPDSIVSGVNRDVCLMSPLVPLASLFVARLDTETGKFEYCSAGHPPALLLRASGKLELLSDGGLLLGVKAGAPYVRGCVQLEAGDVLLAYSDGVLESLNRADEEFGAGRIEEHLRSAAERSSASAEEVLFSVLGAVQDFASARPIVDDISLVIVRGSSAGQ